MQMNITMMLNNIILKSGLLYITLFQTQEGHVDHWLMLEGPQEKAKIKILHLCVGEGHLCMRPNCPYYKYYKSILSALGCYEFYNVTVEHGLQDV